MTLRRQAGGLRHVHLRDCLICTKKAGNNNKYNNKYREILHTIEREVQKSIWRRINQAIDDPSLGAVQFVQRAE
jgi:hypothetical protein